MISVRPIHLATNHAPRLLHFGTAVRIVPAYLARLYTIVEARLLQLIVNHEQVLLQHLLVVLYEYLSRLSTPRIRCKENLVKESQSPTGSSDQRLLVIILALKSDTHLARTVRCLK